MLDPKNAIRIEYRRYGRLGNTRKNHIFKCDNCTHEISVLTCDLGKRTGLCRSCTKRRDPFISTYNAIKYRAMTRELEFSLSYDEFIFLTQIGVCHYCGSANIEWEPFSENRKSNLDRKDNTKGYTFDNVAVCCGVCNAMKRDWLSYEEFKIVSLLLRRWREGTLEDKQELEYMLSAWNMQIN